MDKVKGGIGNYMKRKKKRKTEGKMKKREENKRSKTEENKRSKTEGKEEKIK